MFYFSKKKDNTQITYII
uniref:Uncharacterized protein n=1 Tax=Anguilla anguilla TaxID=7936 RepID=A0A0E9TLI8_ANGAN